MGIISPKQKCHHAGVLLHLYLDNDNKLSKALFKTKVTRCFTDKLMGSKYSFELNQHKLEWSRKKELIVGCYCSNAHGEIMFISEYFIFSQ